MVVAERSARDGTCERALQAQRHGEDGGGVALQHAQQLAVLALPHSNAAVTVTGNHEVQRGQGGKSSDGSLCLTPQHEHLRLRLDVPGNQALASSGESNGLQRVPLQKQGLVMIE
jgi:hypothetical protein